MLHQAFDLDFVGDDELSYCVALVDLLLLSQCERTFFLQRYLFAAAGSNGRCLGAQLRRGHFCTHWSPWHGARTGHWWPRPIQHRWQQPLHHRSIYAAVLFIGFHIDSSTLWSSSRSARFLDFSSKKRPKKNTQDFAEQREAVLPSLGARHPAQNRSGTSLDALSWQLFVLQMLHSSARRAYYSWFPFFFFCILHFLHLIQSVVISDCCFLLVFSVR